MSVYHLLPICIHQYLFQIYNEYIKASDNLIVEKEENKRLNSYLDQILQVSYCFIYGLISHLITQIIRIKINVLYIVHVYSISTWYSGILHCILTICFSLHETWRKPTIVKQQFTNGFSVVYPLTYYRESCCVMVKFSWIKSIEVISTAQLYWWNFLQ